MTATEADFTELLSGLARGVDAWPDRVAISHDERTYTYAELGRLVQGYADGLRSAGVGTDDVVPVVAPRSVDSVALSLGVMWAGAAFLPVEPHLPVERARGVLEQAEPKVVLAAPGLDDYSRAVVGGRSGTGEVRVLSADGCPAADEVRDPGRRLADILAYVIFTSGSTGVPKGAMVTRGGMDNHIEAKRRDLELTCDDVLALTAPLSFDVSVWQGVAALTVGGTTAVASAADLAEPETLLSWVERHGVTVLEVVPSYLAVIVESIAAKPDLAARGAGLRLLVATGEALPSALVRRWHEWFPDMPVLNAYGPTECSDDVTHHVVTAANCAASRWAPIGTAVVNTELTVVGPASGRVPPDESGELMVGGAGVGRGYLRNPRATALAFVPDCFGPSPGARMYRTGDRVRADSDGLLSYLGRRDRQVKIRGHRIELGEVEAHLLDVPGVSSAACVAVDARLHAFVTVRRGADGDAGQIRATLGEWVPAFLLPATVTVLDRMPTNASSKTDVNALEERVRTAGDPSGDTAVPANADETSQAAALVARFAGVESIGPEDNFFAAGGDSLGAMRLVSAARAHFEVENMALRRFIADPTARGLVAAVRSGRSEPSRPRPPRSTGGLSSGQERLWFVENLNRGKDPLRVHLELVLDFDVDRAALQHAIDAVIVRHEPLRSVFGQARGVPTVTVWPEATLPLEILEPEESPPPDELSVRQTDPPLMRAYLARTGPEQHVLTLVLHHLITDGWSLMVLRDELADHYRRHRAGLPDAEKPSTTFGDYVAAERAWLDGPEAEESREFWHTQLRGAPPSIELPWDPPDAPVQASTASEVRVLSRVDTQELARMASAEGATPFMAVLAGFSLFLRELTGEDDVVIGIDSVNRSWPGSEELIGPFVNQLPVRLRTSRLTRFSELLATTRERCLAAYEHERLPFHQIVAVVNPPRQTGRLPLFQVKATHQTAWRSQVEVDGRSVTAREIPDPVMDPDLMLDVSGEDDQLRIELVYPRDRLSEAAAAGWADRLVALLRAEVGARGERSTDVRSEAGASAPAPEGGNHSP